jgi:phosphoribosylformylglycinamidine synthase subunit PurQ / glutaminase
MGARSQGSPARPARPRSAWREALGPIEGAGDVDVMVLSGYGLNCEAETAAGFRMLGARTRIVHAGDLLDGTASLDGVHILVFVGGFSFGDHIASGRVFANRLRVRLGDRLARFVDDGALVLGICNGFQTLVKLGLLPGLDRAAGDPLAAQQASLVANERHGYRDAWVRLQVDPSSPCVFTQGASGAPLEVPSRHGEGKLVFAPGVQERLEAEHLVPVRYVDAMGAPTECWPDNPNGSPRGAAGLCDRTGRIFGIMPHPEAHLYPENHPDWLARRDAGEVVRYGDGLGVLAGGVRAVLT